MLESTGIWRILRVRNLYVALYAITIIGSLTWLFMLSKVVFSITLASIIILIAVIIVLARKKRSKT